MKIFLSPQVSDEEITYSFEGHKIIIDINGVVDDFDFTGLPDGEMTFYDKKGQCTIVTVLPIMPIMSVEKKEGVLYVELLNWIDEEASESELFPEWIDAKDYKKPVIDEKEHDSLEGWDEF